MDGNHAIGCVLVGVALTTLLIRLVWMKSPPFNAMEAGRLSLSKKLLVASTVAGMVAGIYLLSLPMDPEVAKRVAEESYRFN